MTDFGLITVSLVLLTGLLEAIVPWIEPPTECFAVTIPPSAASDPRILAFKRTYALAVAAVTCACAAGWMLVSRGMSESGGDVAALSAVILAATILPLAVAFGLMLHFRSRVRRLKEAEGWRATGARSAALVGEDDVPGPISLAWNLLYAVLAVAMAAFALANYDRFVDPIPMHASFDGTVDSYVEKSLRVLLFPAVQAAFLGIVFAIAHWMMARSKRPIDPSAPATSALAYGRFARVQSIIMLVGGLALCACIGGMFFLPALGLVSLGTAGSAVGVVTGAFVLAMGVTYVLMGQSGGRLAAELRTTDDLARDDDAHWVLGTFYFNPDDPSVVVPKRFGMGWTINHARPAAWLLIALIVLVSVVFVVVTLRLVG